MTSLEVSGLHKSFGADAVLEGLDLTIAPGSFTAILGPSGSGKTTLLRVVAGFERADRGSIRLANEVVDDGDRFVPSQHRRIGYVPQEGALFPHLSVAQNVGFGLARRDRRGPQVNELLEMVGLAGLGRRFPHQLSGGQQQRVALARALAVRPALVLLDEPFSSLDANLRLSVRTDVRRVLAEAGTTAVLVTHDQDEALSLADAVGVIRHGRIGQIDSPEQIYRHPNDPDLARSLGEANFLDGVARGTVVETALGRLELEGPAVREGTQLLVLIRPEQLEVMEPTGPGALEGRVLDCEFYGHDAVVRIRPDGGTPELLIARTTLGSEVLGPGTQVSLHVNGAVVGWPAKMAEAPTADAP
jgi:iron(III) transport system ATP-binding protein